MNDIMLIMTNADMILSLKANLKESACLDTFYKIFCDIFFKKFSAKHGGQLNLKLNLSLTS